MIVQLTTSLGAPVSLYSTDSVSPSAKVTVEPVFEQV